MSNPRFTPDQSYTSWHVGMKEWLSVVGYEGLYEVSRYGQVRRISTGNVLKGNPVPGGYLTVSLHQGKEQKTCTIHRLVCMAFHANPECKPTVNHIDGNKINNAATNLEWATFRENTLNGVQRGTIVGFPRRVPEHQREEIRRRYRAGGVSLSVLGKQYGLSKFGVSYILKEAAQ